jgi:hypothetical protein
VFELNGSPIAGQAVTLIAKLYEIEREAKDLGNNDRLLARQQRSKPVAEALHAWLTTQRQRLVKADATARAIDYSLSNWLALTTFLGDGAVPIDNNAAENAIRPLAVGRNNANRSLMRSRASWTSGPGRKSRLVTSRRGTGLLIKNGISCGGNPTSGDRHGCVRFHSPGAGSMAARQRPGTVRAGLLAPLGRAALLPRNGAHVSLLRSTLRTVVATAPA